MKTGTLGLVLAFGLGSQANAGTVTLTSADVDSAQDINAAINIATADGTEPGTVILDGTGGEFVYTDGDRSINIGVSDLTLRGINLAEIENCADGLFFDAVPVSDILIEGITFDCTGNGIAWTGPGPRERVTVQDNWIQGDMRGVTIGDSLDWTIRRNIIIGGSGDGQSAIELNGGADTTIINNLLVGFRGVALVFDPSIPTLTPPMNHRIVNNRIEALQTGVRLDDGAAENSAVANRICVQTGPAIFLDIDTFNNKVHGNQAALESAGNLIVDLGTDNEVSGNTTLRRGC